MVENLYGFDGGFAFSWSMLRIDNVDACMRNYLTMVMRTSNNIPHHLNKQRGDIILTSICLSTLDRLQISMPLTYTPAYAMSYECFVVVASNCV